MAENETNETTDTTGTEEKETGKGLRAQLEKTLAENRKLKAREMARSFEQIGLTPDKGLGKAIAKEYDGEISTDALLEYAKTEYGYEPPQQEEQPAIAGQIGQEQARLDTVGQAAGSVTTPTQQEILAKAEAEGDTRTSLQIKAAQLEELMFGPRR